jgi:HK97 family phage portal protein
MLNMGLLNLFDLNQDQQDVLADVLNLEFAKANLSRNAINIGISKIANAIAKCEIIVQQKEKNNIKNVKDEVYYRLNIQPNDNETGTDFWSKVVTELLHKNEAVIIRLNSKYYLVDSYETDDRILTSRTYKKITTTIESKTISVNKNFKASEVIHLKYKNINLENLRNDVLGKYDKLQEVAANAYQITKNPKFKLSIESGITFKDAKGNIVDKNEYTEKIKKALENPEVAIILASQGIDLESIKFESTNIDTTELKSLEDIIYKNVAMAFGIPLDIFFGNVKEKADSTDQFITYSIQPIVELINDSFQAKLVGMDGFANGEIIKMDLTRFKHIDLIDNASNLDKLYGIGFSHNDIRTFLGMTTIDEEWANRHFVTKNYSTEGGEE